MLKRLTNSEAAYKLQANIELSLGDLCTDCNRFRRVDNTSSSVTGIPHCLDWTGLN